MPSPLEGRTTVVTGASSGLGARLAEAFSGAGANPVLFARSRERLQAVADRCREAGADPLVVPGDVTEPGSCAGLVDRTIDRFGRLDFLVACAGIGMWARFDEIEDLSVFRRIMEVNYLGVVYPAFFALPHLRRSGGMLVAISSVQGKVGVPYHTAYAASKHAVQGFCDSLRTELRGSGVDVLTVLPHWIRGTRLRERALDAGGAPRGESSPPHGSGAVSAEEVAAAVLGAIRRRRRTRLVPSRLRFLTFLSGAAPGLADGLIARRVEREAAAGRPDRRPPDHQARPPGTPRDGEARPPGTPRDGEARPPAAPRDDGPP